MNSGEFIKYKESSKDLFKNLLEECESLEKKTIDGENYFHLGEKKGFGGKPINEESINEWRKYKKDVDKLDARLKIYDDKSLYDELNKEQKEIIDRCLGIISDCYDFIKSLESEGYILDTEEEEEEKEPEK